MLQLKDGALVMGNQYTRAITDAVQTVFNAHNWLAVVTSGRDSVHGANSYHAKDRALDIRVSMIPEADRQAIRERIKVLLPHFYDVVYEPEVVKDGVIVKGAHFHIEADEKKEHAK